LNRALRLHDLRVWPAVSISLIAALAAIAAVFTTIAAAIALAVITTTTAAVATFVSASAIVIALGVGWRRHPRCRAQSGDRRNESFFHLEAPCAPYGAPSPCNLVERRLNRT